MRWPGDRTAEREIVFTATLEERHLVVTEIETRTQRNVRATGIRAADRELLRDVTVDLNRGLRIVRWHEPDAVDWVAQPVSIVQNADATKALVLPYGQPLSDGTYRLVFSIARHWFATTEPVGPQNTYLDEGAVEVVLAG